MKPENMTTNKPTGSVKGASGRERPRTARPYEIRLDGVLDDRWADWFGGLRITSDGTQTVISGLLSDQPALHGLLAKVRDLGLSLISASPLYGTGGVIPLTVPWTGS
jgi:hypothetical protein